MDRKLYMVSLGCPKNLVDSEVMLGQLTGSGFVLCDDPDQAEVILVNTCGFIQSAVEEGIDNIMEMIQVKQAFPRIRLVVGGCMVQRYGDALRRELPEVDLFLGTEAVPHIAARINRLFSASPSAAGQGKLYADHGRFLMDSTLPRLLATPSHRAFLKVTEGCNNRCSYCIIPSIRGRQRSRTLDDLVREAQLLEAGGVKELTLIAQDLTAYGTDLGSGGPRLAQLLQALLHNTSIAWIRMLYLHPARLDRGIIELAADNERIAPYFDIPLQHVSDRILKRMRRPYDYRKCATLLRTIRSLHPEAAVRTTFMVGFPGETREDVELLASFVEGHRFDHLGVFSYSDEEGATSSKLDGKISEEEKQARLERIMTLQGSISEQKNKLMVGKTVQVLVEGLSRETDLLLEGRTSRQAPEIDGCVYINKGECRPGDFVQAKITEAHPYDLVGEIIEVKK